MADETAIANMALGRLRVGQAIASLDDESTTARWCKQFYDQCRQEVLRAFVWDCAIRVEALAEVADQDFPGWQYVYQYPNGCLRMLAVGDSSGMRTIYSSYSSLFGDRASPEILTNYASRQPWRRALKDDYASQVILSDVPNAYGFFIYDLDTAGVFSPDLASAIAWRLAMEVGGPLQADSARIENAIAQYGLWVTNAASMSFNEMRDDSSRDAESVNCRA